MFLRPRRGQLGATHRKFARGVNIQLTVKASLLRRPARRCPADAFFERCAVPAAVPPFPASEARIVTARAWVGLHRSQRVIARG